MFKDDIENKLKEKLAPSAIRMRQAFGEGNKMLSYLEGWYVQAELNRVFGHGGWSQEVKELKEVASYTVDKNGKTNNVVIWHAVVQITILHGETWVTREDVGVGVGEGMNMAAITEKTIKEAVTDGMKRAAKSLGDRFGLALYDKEQEGVMTKEEERFMVQEATIKALMESENVPGVTAWYANNQAGLNKGKTAFPDLAENIDALLKSVEDFIKSKQE